MVQRPERPKRIAFLDTNALLRLFDYWETCKFVKLQLNACNDMPTLKAALIESGMKITDILGGDDLNPIRQGMILFHALVAKKDDWDMYTSCICISEFRHTLLEKLAAERLVSLRIPYRLVLERPLRVFRRILRTTDYNKLQFDVDEFFNDLPMVYDIPIITAEETDTNLSTVSETADTIWSRLLIEVMDALIYASAITVMANVLITRDGAFLEAIRNLWQPPDTEWKSMRMSLLHALAKVTRTYSLPEGRHVIRNAYTTGVEPTRPDQPGRLQEDAGSVAEMYCYLAPGAHRERRANFREKQRK